MRNFRACILLVLISLSIQDKNCLVYFEYCKDNEVETPVTTGSINNCILYNNYDNQEHCGECKSGYAISYDSTKCISFENCYNLDSEDKKCINCKEGYAISSEGKCVKFDNCRELEDGNNQKCKTCVNSHFHPDSNGKCQRTLCSNYDDNDVCTSCFYGYYLNDNKNCLEITIPNCIQVNDKDKTKCSLCIDKNSPHDDGNCYIPSNLIKGCQHYDKDGKCLECEKDNYVKNGDTCTFIECKNGKTKIEYCAACKKGYDDYEKGDLCINLADGSKDSSSTKNIIGYSMLISILVLLI